MASLFWLLNTIFTSVVLLALALSSLIIPSDSDSLAIFFAILAVTFLICALSKLVRTTAGLGCYTAGVLLMWIGHVVSLVWLPRVDEQLVATVNSSGVAVLHNQSEISRLVFYLQLILLIASMIFLVPMLIVSWHRVRKGRPIAPWERSDKRQRGNKSSPSDGSPQNETPPNAVDGASELDTFESSNGRQHRDDPLRRNRGTSISVLDNATLESVAGLGESSLPGSLPAYQRPPPAYQSPGSVTCSRPPSTSR